MVRELLLSDFYFLRKLYYISKTEYSENYFSEYSVLCVYAILRDLQMI